MTQQLYALWNRFTIPMSISGNVTTRLTRSGTRESDRVQREYNSNTCTTLDYFNKSHSLCCTELSDVGRAIEDLRASAKSAALAAKLQEISIQLMHAMDAQAAFQTKRGPVNQGRSEERDEAIIANHKYVAETRAASLGYTGEAAVKYVNEEMQRVHEGIAAAADNAEKAAAEKKRMAEEKAQKAKENKEIATIALEKEAAETALEEQSTRQRTTQVNAKKRELEERMRGAQNDRVEEEEHEAEEHEAEEQPNRAPKKRKTRSDKGQKRKAEATGESAGAKKTLKTQLEEQRLYIIKIKTIHDEQGKQFEKTLQMHEEAKEAEKRALKAYDVLYHRNHRLIRKLEQYVSRDELNKILEPEEEEDA